MKKNQTNIKKINVFLQARSNSNRLPFKSLLTIDKIPLAILCAKRLMGKNFSVSILTSKNKSDDCLVDIIKKNKVKYFRGDLKNVYKRFLDASKNLDQDAIIVRATADNPFVNYSFVKNTIKVFLENDNLYKGINYKKHNLPYGMSIEIFRKNLLLKHKIKLSNQSKEHVTNQFYKYDDERIVNNNKLDKDFSNLSCSIDTFEDYKRMNQVFKKFKNPTTVSWEKLIYQLKKYKHNNSTYLNKTRYTLGGAQIGNNYANFKELNVSKLYKKKEFKNYFNNIDTAVNYSRSHQKISKIKQKNKKINITTKLNFSDRNVYKNYCVESFYINFYKLLLDLDENKIDTLLIHNYKDFKNNHFKILNIFKKLKSINLINNFGVSIYYPKELNFLMKNFSNLSIQFPINFIDHRWDSTEIIKLKKKSNSTLIGRSIFLRGKLLEKNGYIEDSRVNTLFLKRLSEIKKKYSINSNLELCIKFVNSLNYLNNIVIGFENLNQIKQAIIHYNKKFKYKDIKLINKEFEFLDTKYIDLKKL